LKGHQDNASSLCIKNAGWSFLVLTKYDLYFKKDEEGETTPAFYLAVMAAGAVIAHLLYCAKKHKYED
jgi:hypothetical protein